MEPAIAAQDLKLPFARAPGQIVQPWVEVSDDRREALLSLLGRDDNMCVTRCRWYSPYDHTTPVRSLFASIVHTKTACVCSDKSTSPDHGSKFHYSTAFR